MRCRRVGAARLPTRPAALLLIERCLDSRSALVSSAEPNLTDAPEASPFALPSRLVLALESRALAELSAFYMSAPLLGLGRQGEGHPALVLPGFATSDRATAPLRTALRRAGYQAHGWRLGSNRGSNSETVERTADHLRMLSDRSGQQVSIIGHSAGGMLGRELARRAPEVVRQVITVGSPFRFRRGDRSNMTAHRGADPRPEHPSTVAATEGGASPAVAGADHGDLLAHRRHRRLAQLHRGGRRSAGERRGAQQPRRPAPPPGRAGGDPRSPRAAARPLGAVRSPDPAASNVPHTRDVAAGIDTCRRSLNGRSRASGCGDVEPGVEGVHDGSQALERGRVAVGGHCAAGDDLGGAAGLQQ